MNHNKSDLSPRTPDIFYYDIIMPGLGVEFSSRAVYQDNRAQALIDSPEDYYMSVIRFSIDGSVIPLFVCPIILNQIGIPNPNLTPFVVYFIFNGVTYQKNVIYIPEENGPAPPFTIPQNTINNFYYYVYYYSSFLNMVNITIAEVFALLTAANPSLINVAPPYYSYDRTTQLISLIVPNVIVGGINIFLTQFNVDGTPNVTTNTNVSFFLNAQLYAFFDGIEAFNIIDKSNPDFLIVFRDTKNNYFYPPINKPNVPITNQTLLNISAPDIVTPSYNDVYTAQPAWFIFTQQYHVVSSWNSLSSIVFLTRSIPVQKEYIPSFAINNALVTVASSSRSVLTDFVPDLTLAGQQRERFVYTANIYRLIELNSNIPLYQIDLEMFWTDRLQNLYPIYINYTQVNSVKLMFIKKSIVAKNPSQYKFY